MLRVTHERGAQGPAFGVNDQVASRFTFLQESHPGYFLATVTQKTGFELQTHFCVNLTQKCVTIRFMTPRRITSADLVEVTGFSRHRLRSFLKDLPGYSEKQGIERVAKEYSRQDLTVIAVCCELEDRYRMRHDAIVRLVLEVRKALSEPRSVTTDALLIVIPNPPSARYVDGASDVREGTVLPLSNILNRVDSYLLGDQLMETGGQRNLDLGPVPILTTRLPNVTNNNHQRRTGSKNATG